MKLFDETFSNCFISISYDIVDTPEMICCFNDIIDIDAVGCFIIAYGIRFKNESCLVMSLFASFHVIGIIG